MSNMADQQELRGRERALAFLERFQELGRFFTGTTSLSTAIGVSRDTILAWRQGDTSRVRQANELRVSHLLEVCLAAAEHLPEDEQVGRWMQAPQTFLYGGTPIEYLDDGGDPRFLIESMEPPVAAVDEKALGALSTAEAELAELVAESRRRQAMVADRADADPTRAGVVDLMEALRRSVAEEQQFRAVTGRRRRPRVVTAKRYGGGWINIIEGQLVVPSLWRTKREAERAARMMAQRAGAAHVTLADDGRESVREPVAKFGRR